MMNLRDIFKVSYGYMMMGVIGLIIIGILLINRKEIGRGIRYLSNVSLISGVIMIVIDLIIYLGIDTFINYNYKIFIRVVSDSLFTNLLYGALISVAAGVILKGIYKVKFSN